MRWPCGYAGTSKRRVVGGAGLSGAPGISQAILRRRYLNAAVRLKSWRRNLREIAASVQVREVGGAIDDLR